MNTNMQKISKFFVSLWEDVTYVISRVIERLPRRFELSADQKEDVWQTIKEDSTYTQIYWIQMGLSALIASLGLLQNSTAVVIGAMLVAPLLRPMQGIAYGIASSRSSFFLKNLRVLGLSTLLSVGIGFFTLVITPLSIETPEILARVAPNFIDLMIAVASAAVAYLALSFKSLSASIAGVAMAASLVPPLSAAGITFAMGSFSHAWGSFFLYLTNLLAIIVVGVLVFMLYGYRPHQEGDKQKTAKQVALLLLMIIVVSIPLGIALSRLAEVTKVQNSAIREFDSYVKENLPEIKVVSTDFSENDNKEVVMLVTLALPETADFYLEDQENISQHVADSVSSDMQIDFTLVRTSSIRATVEEDLPSNDKKIEGLVSEILDTSYPDVRVIDLNVSETDSLDSAAYLVEIVVTSKNSLDEKKLEMEIRETDETLKISPAITVLAQYSNDLGKEKGERELYIEYLKSEIASIVSQSLLPEEILTEVVVNASIATGLEVGVGEVSEFEVELWIASPRSSGDILAQSTIQEEINTISEAPFTLVLRRTPLDVTRIQQEKEVLLEEVLSEG